MTAGRFIDFYLPYAGNDGRMIPASEQAARILAQVSELVDAGAVGAAVLYSANYGQTRAIARAYDRGEATAGIGGANQAQVMSEVERALRTTHAALAGRFRIAPITTMNGYPPDELSSWNEDAHLGVVRADVARVEDWLGHGWCVLGWQNQLTVGNVAHPYAIGGGVTAVPAAVDLLIQSELQRLAGEYRD